MGSLFSALYIARAGMQVAQVQLDVAGHNIANVGKEGFSRQRVNLVSRVPIVRPFGAIGRGPRIAGIERLREGFLDEVFRNQMAGLGRAETAATFFSRIEDVFLEPGENGFSNRLNSFFASLNDFANNVEELPVRVALLAEGEAVAASLNDASRRLELLRTNANEQVRDLVPEINSLAERIAELNASIQRSEIGGREASDLRDDRDVLLDKLSRIVAVTVRERDDGQVNIFLGGDELVVGRRVRLLETVVNPAIDPERPEFLEVRFVHNGQTAQITDGDLAGALAARDVHVRDVLGRLDNIARGLIESMNHLHSQGRGIERIASAHLASNAVSAATDPLNSTGLTFTIQDGSFDLVVYDNTGAVVETVTVNVVASGPPAGQTTLAGVAAVINGAANLSATVDANGFLTITPAAGRSFTFANDSSGALTALGVNPFFTGDDAASIAVSQHLSDNPALVSSGRSLDALDSGDNSVALDMAALQDVAVLSNNTQTIHGFYESLIVQVGIDARANLETLQVEQTFVTNLAARRQEVSGVNLNEEVTNLIRFQRAFEASARIVTVTDRMLDALLNMVR